MRGYPICAAARNLDLKQLAESFIRRCVKREALKIMTGRPESVSVTYDQLYNDLYALYYAFFCFESPENGNNFTREVIYIMVLYCSPESSNKALLNAGIPEKGILNIVGTIYSEDCLEYVA